MSDEPNKQSFFLPGDCKDMSYRNVRDNPYKIEWRTFTEEIWSMYHDLGIEDSHFLNDARNHFLERFWEMYLSVTLHDHGFKLERYGNKGPEFYFLHNNRKVWVEAVAPGPGVGNDRVPGYCPGEVTKVPVEKILLRLTNALEKKRNQYWKARNEGIINSDDLYLLAINSRGIPHAPYGDTLPYIVRAFLPFGNLAILINAKTKEIKETYYQLHENIKKESGANVETTAFLNPEFSFVSAILHSGVDCANHPEGLGDDFIILHNPTASHHLDSNLFHWCQQIFYEDGHLEFRPEKK